MVRPAQSPTPRIEVHPPGCHRPYFANFVCREHRLIVEIDGGTHSSLQEEIVRDQQRSADLAVQGYRIFRVHNEEVYQSLDEVLDHLLAFARGEAD